MTAPLRVTFKRPWYRYAPWRWREVRRRQARAVELLQRIAAEDPFQRTFTRILAEMIMHGEGHYTRGVSE